MCQIGRIKLSRKKEMSVRLRSLEPKQKMTHTSQTRCHFKDDFYQTNELPYRGGFKENLFEGEGHQETKLLALRDNFQKERGKKVLRWQNRQASVFMKEIFMRNKKFQEKINLMTIQGFFSSLKELMKRFSKRGEKKDREFTTTNQDLDTKGVQKQLKRKLWEDCESKQDPYCDQFKEGVPHDQGYEINSAGNTFSLIWNQGAIQT